MSKFNARHPTVKTKALIQAAEMGVYGNSILDLKSRYLIQGKLLKALTLLHHMHYRLRRRT